MRKSKRFISILLIVAMLLSVITVAPFTVYAIDIADDVGAIVSSDPEMDTVGATEYTSGDYKYTLGGSNVTITGYIGSGGTVSIPSYIDGYKVTAIGDGAFYGNTNITEVTISNYVTYLGQNAFRNCTGLTTASIGSGVEKMGNQYNSYQQGCFQGCINLKSVTISEGVKEIGLCNFSGCSSLQRVTIPKSVSIIKPQAFNECSSLTYAYISNGVQTIDSSAFSNNTSLTDLYIGNTVQTIGESAFSGCKNLPGVNIPDSVTVIGQNAFRNCTGLTTASIGSGVEKMGNQYNSYQQGCFQGCTFLTTVTIKQGAKQVGLCDYNDCTSLTSITIPSSVESIGGLTIDSDNLTHGNIFRNHSEYLTIYGTSNTLAHKFANANNIPFNEIVTDIKPTDLYLNTYSKTLELGAEFQLVATVVPDNVTDKSVKWWSSDESIATVTNTSETLEVAFEPSYTNAKDLTWNSADPSIATIASDGKVTAKKAGETTVTAQTTNGKGCYCHVVVKEKTYAQTYGWSLSNNEESYGYDKLEHDKNGNPKHPIALRNLISQYGYNIPSYAYAELQQLCHSSWTGYCFGLSILSLAQYYGKVDLKPYFSQSGEYLYDFGYEKIYTDASGHDCFSIEGNSKAIDLIEVAHTYQYSPTFSTCRVFNFDDHYANLLSFLNSDEAHPIMVNLGDGISGHTMVITTDEKPDLISGTTDWYYLPLYDPNAPANSDKLKNPESYYTRDDTFLAVNTTTTEWSYYCNGNEIYNGNFRTLGFANIKFYDISKLSSHFLTNRLPSPNSVLNLFADNIKIMGNNNQVLLQVKDGQITDLDEGCEISVMSSVTDSGENRIFIFSTEEEKLKIKTDGAEIFSSTPDYMFIAKTDSDSTIEYDSSKGVIQSRSSGGNAVIAVQELSSEQCVMLSDASAQSKMSARVQNDTVEICSENRDITVNSSNIAEEKTNISDHQLYAGDVNSDSLLNMKDIVLLQQSLNSWDVSINEYASDVNNDGTINMKDIVLIQQALNGWDVVLK